MEYIIQLLEDRNLHLEKFSELNEKEVVNFAEGNFDNLENFYKSREGILNLLNCIDRLIEDSPCKPPITDEQKRDVLELLSRKNEIVTEILSQDLQILSLIEQAKSEIIKELSTVKAGRKALQNYQTGNAPRRLDNKY